MSNYFGLSPHYIYMCLVAYLYIIKTYFFSYLRTKKLFQGSKKVNQDKVYHKFILYLTLLISVDIYWHCFTISSKNPIHRKGYLKWEIKWMSTNSAIHMPQVVNTCPNLSSIVCRKCRKLSQNLLNEKKVIYVANSCHGKPFLIVLTKYKVYFFLVKKHVIIVF